MFTCKIWYGAVIIAMFKKNWLPAPEVYYTDGIGAYRAMKWQLKITRNLSLIMMISIFFSVLVFDTAWT